MHGASCVCVGGGRAGNAAGATYAGLSGARPCAELGTHTSSATASATYKGRRHRLSPAVPRCGSCVCQASGRPTPAAHQQGHGLLGSPFAPFAYRPPPYRAPRPLPTTPRHRLPQTPTTTPHVRPGPAPDPQICCWKAGPSLCHVDRRGMASSAAKPPRRPPSPCCSRSRLSTSSRTSASRYRGPYRASRWPCSTSSRSRRERYLYGWSAVVGQGGKGGGLRGRDRRRRRVHAERMWCASHGGLAGGAPMLGCSMARCTVSMGWPRV